MEPPYVQLWSSVPNGTCVCSQQMLMFTCITTGFLVVWRSNEYFNNNLEEITFTRDSAIQRERTFGSVKAVLTDVTTIGSSVTLNSTLIIVVTEHHQRFSVSCHGDNSKIVKRRSYYLNGEHLHASMILLAVDRSLAKGE